MVKILLPILFFVFTTFAQPVNHAWAYYKMGDQDCAADKHCFKDGDLVEVIDPNEQPGNPADYEISDEMKAIFFVTKIPTGRIPILRGLARDSLEPDHPDYKLRRAKLDLDDVASRLKISRAALDELRFDKEPFELDAFGKTDPIEARTKDSKLTGVRVKDVNAWTGGDVTVGPGGTYATHVALEADAGTFTSNSTVTVVGDIVEGTLINFNNDFGAFDVDFNGGGYTISCNQSNWLIIFRPAKTGTIRFYNYNFKRILAASSASVGLFETGSTTAGILHIFNSTFDGGGLTGAGITVTSTSQEVDIFQVLIYNGGGNGSALRWTDSQPGSTVENITLRNYATGLQDGGVDVLTARNVASLDNSVDYFDLGTLTAFEKCASSDATGSDASLRNLTPGDVFQSTTPGDANFLLPVAGSALQDAATPTLWTTDLNGNPNTNYIGALQAVAPAGNRGKYQFPKYTPEKYRVEKYGLPKYHY